MNSPERRDQRAEPGNEQPLDIPDADAVFSSAPADQTYAALLGLLNRIGYAAVVLNDDSRVVCFNKRAFETIGAQLKLRRAAPESVGKMIQQIRFARPSTALFRRSGKRPVVAQLMSVCSDAEESKLLLVLIDPDHLVSPSEDALRHVYGLTPAEARLAIRIACGDRLHDIASQYDIKMETVRKQLKAVLAKTQTSRQAELAVLLARLSIIDKP
jgi:DNA-binding CsgD family transcriptional regulator